MREVIQIVQRFIDAEGLPSNKQTATIYINDSSIRLLVTSGLANEFRIPQGGITEQKWYRVQASYH